MTNPIVSVCVPAYRAKPYVAKAVESVLSQDFTDWELIVTEDGSDDGTVDLVRDLTASVTQPVSFHRHKWNKGLPATRNSGIAVARGMYIALLDADDYWECNHITALYNAIVTNDADVVHSGSVLFDSESDQILCIRAPSTQVIRGFPSSLYTADYVIQPSSAMFKRELWQRIGGFDESFRYVEDREMWIRCARSGARFAFSGENTCYYRKHSGALSTHSAEMAIANARVFQRHLDWVQIPMEVREIAAIRAWTGAARILQRAQPWRACELLRHARTVKCRPGYDLWMTGLKAYAMISGG